MVSNRAVKDNSEKRFGKCFSLPSIILTNLKGLHVCHKDLTFSVNSVKTSLLSTFAQTQNALVEIYEEDISLKYLYNINNIFKFYQGALANHRIIKSVW